MVSSFIEGWDLVQTLGEGAYGEVKLAVNTTTNEKVAVKFINLKKNTSARESVRKEIAIHKLLKHDHVIRFYGSRTAGDLQYMFLEYACCGELFDRIDPDAGMSPQHAQYYFRQLIDGLEYLHSRGVAHRDLKPENLLLDENENLKISDFGMATVFRYQGEEREMEKCCGTLPYVAPEVIRRRPYSAQPADIWSCGIILVAMLAGELPWDEPSNDCQEYSDWNKFCILNSPWNKIENMALFLLRKILIENSKKRYTIPQMKKNQWFLKNLRKSMPLRLENLSGESGTLKRVCSGLDQSSPSALGKFDHQFSLSQPDVISRATESPSSAAGSLKAITYSQPVRPDHMMLSSQHQTQESQSSGPHLVRRLTRFFVNCNEEATVKELTKAFETLAFTWKKNNSLGLFTIQTFDRRKCPLSFKAALVKMGDNLLVDFRLSKGDGIQFKRNFTKIRNLLRPIILSQSAWSTMVSPSVKELHEEDN